MKLLYNEKNDNVIHSHFKDNYGKRKEKPKL